MPSLAPVDYDPFAAQKRAPPPGPKLQPVDHDPWAQDEALRGELMGDVPGARITSTFRTPEHNRDVGGVSDSRHLKDDAVDFIPPAGMTRAQAVAAIRARDPHPQELLDEGDHIHYSPSAIPKLTPVDHDPFSAAAPASPARKSSTVAPAASQPASTPKPQDGWDPVGDFTAPIKAAGHQVMEDVRGDIKGKPTSPVSIMDIPHLAGVPWAVLQGAMNVPIEAGARAIEATGVPLFDPVTRKPVTDPAARRAQLAAGLAQASMAIAPEKGGEAGFAEAGRPHVSPVEAGARETAAAAEAPKLRTSTLPKPPKLTPVEGDPFAASGKPKPRKLLAAQVELPPRTDVVGDEANPATRTANALYRLGGHDTDARIELGRADAAMRKTHGPETDEALYHALEEPDKPMTPEVEAAKKDLDPLLERQTAVINRLRERADPTLDPYLTDSGYVHRIKAGDESALDENASRSPFDSRKSLVKKADSQKQRKFITLENSQTGERTLVDTSERPEFKDYRPGQEYRPEGEGPHGVAPAKFKVVSPTTKEIEAKVPGLKFQKSAIHNTAVNVYQLERAERNLDVLEQTLSDMKERGVAHKAYNSFKGEDGLINRVATKGDRPKGFVQIPDNPHFQDWVFDSKDGQVQELKDWLPDTQRGFQGDALDKLDRISNFMLRSNFLSPIVHPKNIAEFWAASRGGEWLNPAAYGRMSRTLGEAAREVFAMGPKYRQLLREGSALLSADSRTQKFTTLLTDTAAKQMFDDPKGFEAFKKALGDAAMTPVKAYQAFQAASHKMMWGLGDIMMMQRVLELQEKGTPIRDAIRKAEDVIPNYRVPAQIMDSKVGGRFLNSIFSNNRIFAIGRYHYNRMAAWGRMAKKVAVGTAEEKAEAIGQLLVVAVQAAIVAPLMDQALKLATGNQNARVKRGGITALPDAAEGVSSGREGPAQAIAQVLDLSPGAELAKEYIGQKDWKGDDLASKFKTTPENIAGEAEPLLNAFGPLQGGIEALQPGYGAERVAGNAFGVELPEKPQGAVKGSTAKMLRSKYRKQDRKDPFVQTLEGLGVR